METCTGNGFHPGDKIKYSGMWCPLCKMALTLENVIRQKEILKKCLRHTQVIKPSRRRDDAEGLK